MIFCKIKHTINASYLNILNVCEQWVLSNSTHQGTRKMCRIVQDVVKLRFYIRNQPFNYVFFLFRILFFHNTSLNIFFFFVVQSAIFFPEFNIRLYDKNSESHFFFFPPPKSEYFFSNIGNQNIFLEKKHSLSPGS